MLDERTTLYDILELAPDATPQEIREAYLRLKSAYNKDSAALYTLLSDKDTESMRLEIENAYQVLSNPERRRDYDLRYGLISDHEIVYHPTMHTPSKKDKSDKTLEMELKAIQENLDNPLNPPSTEIQSAIPAPMVASTPPLITEAPAAVSASVAASPVSEIDQEILSQTDWSGDFIRKVRQSRNVSIEELADFTKISRSYLKAIEDEDFDKLPAAVYLRGFLVQISKKLRLPSDTVAASYVAKYRHLCPKKA